jgi:hypothetical protein
MALATVYDAIEVSNYPAGGDGYLGYINGAWPTYEGIKARGKPTKSISVYGTDALALSANIADCEAGDYNPAEAAQWAQLKIAGNLGRPTIYSSTSVYNDLANALAAHRLQFGINVDWLEAHYDNIPTISTLPGAIGKQYQSTLTFDISVVYFDWLILQSANRPDLTVSTF